MKTAKIRVLNGVMDFVKKATGNPGILSGLGTGNLERGARLKLEPTGLNPYFKFGGYGSDAEDRAEMLAVSDGGAPKDIAGEKLDRCEALCS